MIYLREKRSGNFELTNKVNSTIKFKTQKAFKNWYKNGDENSNGCKYSARIIKAKYSRSQTYFYTAQEVINFIKAK